MEHGERSVRGLAKKKPNGCFNGSPAGGKKKLFTYTISLLWRDEIGKILQRGERVEKAESGG